VRSCRRTEDFYLVEVTYERPSVRPLVVSDVGVFLRHVISVDAGSGLDGAAHSHAYGRDEPFDMEDGQQRETLRWSTAIAQVGWRRAWGLFDEEELIGYADLAGGTLASELHRTRLGIGVARPHRRRGGGTTLLGTAIAWARAQTGIAWIDLGVISDNAPARALYRKHGFQELGLTVDRFRVDGVSLDEVSMTLNVGRHADPPGESV
jgi:RimJ/RimL family protein N-acetyltransferase